MLRMPLESGLATTEIVDVERKKCLRPDLCTHGAPSGLSSGRLNGFLMHEQGTVTRLETIIPLPRRCGCVPAFPSIQSRGGAVGGI